MGDSPLGIYLKNASEELISAVHAAMAQEPGFVLGSGPVPRKPSLLIHELSDLPEDDLQNILLQSARHLDRNIQLLERGAQGPDHPVHPAIVETRYIKSLTCRILPS